MSSEFRDYQRSSKGVRDHYRKLRKNQTVEYNRLIRRKIAERERKHEDFWEVLHRLDSFIDVSDPDISLPNSVHCFQTAEAIRKDGHPEWLQLVGLIHDMGKHIYATIDDDSLGISEKEQWGCVGDTFIVGCDIPDKCVFPEFNELNPDMKNKKYQGDGIYKQQCGLDKLMCSYGHDEYMYNVLTDNDTVTLPLEAYYIVRYHSFYPWHDADCYERFENGVDTKMKKYVQLFNQYDLYTKEDVAVDVNKLKPYYDGLVKKYLSKDGKLWW